MGFPLDACDAAQDIRAAELPLIRYTRCGENFSSQLQDDGSSCGAATSRSITFNSPIGAR